MNVEAPKMEAITPVVAPQPAQPVKPTNITVDELIEIVNKQVDERVKAGQISTAVAGMIKSKTMWFAAAVAALPEVLSVLQVHLSQMPAPEDKMKLILWAVAAGIAILRVMTKESITEKAIK